MTDYDLQWSKHPEYLDGTANDPEWMNDPTNNYQCRMLTLTYGGYVQEGGGI